MRRILFLGQKQFGEAAWQELNNKQGKGYEIFAVCSNESAESVWWRSNRIYETRGEVPFIDNKTKNEERLIEVIRQYRIDTILCVQQSWILSPQILEAVNYRALNFHNAKLPEYRGYNAINHAILNGDRTFTCTAHWIADEVDKGDIALETTFDIAHDETAISLYAKSYHAGLRLFNEALSCLDEIENLPRRPTKGIGHFYSRKSTEHLREIKSLAFDDVDIKSRAFFFPPFEPAFFGKGGKKVYVLPCGLTQWGFKLRGIETLNEMIEMTGKSFACEIDG